MRPIFLSSTSISLFQTFSKAKRGAIVAYVRFGYASLRDPTRPKPPSCVFTSLLLSRRLLAHFALRPIVLTTFQNYFGAGYFYRPVE